MAKRMNWDKANSRRVRNRALKEENLIRHYKPIKEYYLQAKGEFQKWKSLLTEWVKAHGSIKGFPNWREYKSAQKQRDEAWESFSSTFIK